MRQKDKEIPSASSASLHANNVLIDAVDKRTIEIEDEDGLYAHGFLQARRRVASRLLVTSNGANTRHPEGAFKRSPVPVSIPGGGFVGRLKEGEKRRIGIGSASDRMVWQQELTEVRTEKRRARFESQMF